MELLSLNCNHCGAPLEVPSSARFVTCNHCNSKLAVKRTGSTTYTELLEQIDQRTEQLTEQVAHLSYQNEIHRLDREWELERERYMVTGKHGHRRIPSETGSLVGGAVATVFGIGWMVFASQIGGGAFALFGLVFIGIAIFGSFNGVTKANRYRQAERRYRQRRESLHSDDFLPE